MSSTAYAKVAEQVASPRELEARALLAAAGKLKELQTEWDPRDPRLIKALTFNRRLWSIFVGAACEEDCPHPKELRENIANMGVFIFNHSLDIEFDPAPEKLDALIDINMNVAAGLQSAPA